MLDRQTAAREHHDVALPPREFYAGDAVWVVNFAGITKMAALSTSDQIGSCLFHHRID